MVELLSFTNTNTDVGPTEENRFSFIDNRFR